MVEGNEWDVEFRGGKIVWKKPSEEVLTARLQSQVDLRQWGEGWRKGVLWMVWKILGSPEGVFEYEGGKKDGKLVLRDLSKSSGTLKGQPFENLEKTEDKKEMERKG